MTDDSADDTRPAAPAPETGERTTRQPRSGAFLGVPIEVTISVGKARPLVSELVELRRDSVLTLDSTIDDPVELYIGDRLIARGELQELGDDSGRLGRDLAQRAHRARAGRGDALLGLGQLRVQPLVGGARLLAGLGLGPGDGLVDPGLCLGGSAGG